MFIGHKQNRELNDDVLLTRQRAVMSLCDYLHDPEHISAAIDEGKLIMAGLLETFTEGAVLDVLVILMNCRV